VSRAERSVRYPASAATFGDLERILAACPEWAKDKFVVLYQGLELNYAKAERLVNRPPRVTKR